MSLHVLCSLVHGSELHRVLRYADTLESQMMAELENARLVRLLAKLGFVNERPELVWLVGVSAKD